METSNIQPTQPPARLLQWARTHTSRAAGAALAFLFLAAFVVVEGIKGAAAQGFTMPAITISGDDILATAASVITQLSPIIVLIGGIAIGLWVVMAFIRMLKGAAR